MEALKKKTESKKDGLFSRITTVPDKRIISCIYFLFVCSAITYAQNNNLKLTTDFETFDIERFNRLEGEDSQLKKEVLSDGTRISYHHMFQSYSCVVYPPDSHIALSKHYYSNGNIEEKGLVFTNQRFRIGIWYFFDEEGNLKEEKDYDVPYKFTLNDMLEFARQQGVEFPKTPEILEKDYPQINRSYNEDEKNCWWELSRVMDDDLYIETFHLDCETGEVFSTEIEYRGRRIRYEK